MAWSGSIWIMLCFRDCDYAEVCCVMFRGACQKDTSQYPVSMGLAPCNGTR